MAKKLHYFNIIAIAEPIRYILYYTKQDFEDIKYDYASWPDPEFKKTLPFGQLPIYVEGDKVLNQSLAITKYVARDTDLIPADAWQQAVLDSTVYNIYDYWKSIGNFVHESDPVKRQALQKVIEEETIDFYFSRFEKHLEENGGYFIGKLSWAEFVFCALIEGSNVFLGIEVEKNYPLVKKLVEKVKNLPGVKEYIATRAFDKFEF